MAIPRCNLVRWWCSIMEQQLPVEISKRLQDPISKYRTHKGHKGHYPIGRGQLAVNYLLNF